MLFMVIEHFRNQDAIAIYTHLRDKGRGLPEGLRYIDSWVEPNFDRCFQLMELRRPAFGAGMGSTLARAWYVRDRSRCSEQRDQRDRYALPGPQTR